MTPLPAAFFLFAVVVFVFWPCIAAPDIVLFVEPAGEAMLPPDMEPELAGVDDGPDIDPPVWAKAVPARAAAARVMIAKAAVRVVRVFMVVPQG
jgi:hypothetical protein